MLYAAMHKFCACLNSYPKDIEIDGSLEPSKFKKRTVIQFNTGTKDLLSQLLIHIMSQVN